MNIFNRLLNLFHQKHRLNPQYEKLATLKKLLFFGATGFMMVLSFSKFFQSNLIYSFEPTEENKLLIKLNPALERSVYTPTMFMIFGVMQRLYTKYWEEDPYIRIKQEEFEGQTLHWVTLHDKATHKANNKMKLEIPVVLVIAGSEGFDNTAKHLMLASYNLGYRTVAVDPKDVYDTQKIHEIVNHIRLKFPLSNLYGIGIEYGANLLINYAADHPKQFSALVSLGNPFDIVKSEVNLQQSWTWKLLYRNILQGRLEKGKKMNSKLDENNIHSLFELDKHLYNLKDEQLFEWKLKNSCINSINKLQDTTMFIQSREDPFSQDIGNDERFENQKCIYITTQRGGHNEWLENIWMNRWFVSPVKYFLKLNYEGKIEKIQMKQKAKQQPK